MGKKAGLVGYKDPEFAILLSYTVPITFQFVLQFSSKRSCERYLQLRLFPKDPDLTSFQVSITVSPITNDLAIREGILLFSVDSFFAYDAIYADFVPQKVRAEDALAEMPKAEET
ncbi:hypothetical protein HAX54_031520 [Datura stramonium]|uniref:Uncharacterized protein n=1 Tax=Datura stramonium TaxID=4076 RepID=A0ABS8RGP9_DATST|nr:hypothetical protein [Datura stramonium]